MMEMHSKMQAFRSEDNDRRRMVVKNTFVQVEESPRSPATRRHARKCKTAPEALLAACAGAKFSSRGLSADEERDGELASTSPSSSSTIAVDPDEVERGVAACASSASVCTSSSSLSLSGAFSDLKKKKKKSGGIMDLRGKRPGKKARMRYQIFAESVAEAVRADPSLSLEFIELPAFVCDNDMLKAKLRKRMEATRLAVGGAKA
jgi:hypothetical protein